MIGNKEELFEARTAALQQLNAYDCRILVCSGTGCIATGSNKIHEIFEKLVKETPGVELVFSPCGGDHEEKAVGVKKTGCQGFCELGPLVRIQKGEKVIQYVKVQPDDCAEIIEKSVIGDEVIERLLYHKGETAYVEPDEIPFIANAFGFTPIGWDESGIAMALAIGVIPVVELVKLIQRAIAKRKDK